MKRSLQTWFVAGCIGVFVLGFGLGMFLWNALVPDILPFQDLSVSIIHGMIELALISGLVVLVARNRTGNRPAPHPEARENLDAAVNSELLALHQISIIAMGSQTLKGAYQKIVEEIRSSTGFPTVLLEIADELGRPTSIQGITGMALATEQGPIDLAAMEALSKMVVDAGRCVMETNVPKRLQNVSRVPGRPSFQTYVGAPMITSQTVMGTLSLAHPQALELDEHFSRWVAILADHVTYMTERRRTEEAWRRSEERYRSLVDNAPDAIFTLSPEGTITSLSPAFEIITGWSRSEWIGKPLAGLVHPEDRNAASELIEMVMRGETMPALEVRLQLKSGRYFLAECIATRIEEGSRHSMLGIARDITERKQAEDALRKSEDRFHAFMENSPAVAFMKDEEWRYIYINKAQERLFQRDWTAVLGKTDFDLWPLQTAMEMREHDRAVLAAGKTMDWFETVPSSNGPARDWLVFKFPFQLGTGQRYLGGMAVDVTEHKRAEERIQRQLEYNAALRNIDQAINASLDLGVTLKVLLDQVTTQLHVDSAAVLLLNPDQHTLQYAAGRGFYSNSITHSSLRLGQGYAGRSALERRPICIPNLAEVDDEWLRGSIIASEGFVGYYATPLIAKGQVKGVLEILHRAPLNPDQERLRFLESLADHAAIAIDNAALFDDLQRTNLELGLAYETTLEGWSRALDLRDRETEGHTQRVTEETLRLARVIGMREADLVHVRRGALLHDIGKICIPDNILLKPGPLSEQEWELMHEHPVYAYKLLAPIAYLRPALDIPYCHHEKWDGTGYPRGLRGKEIPLAARIFSLVDVWDALRSNRPYRAGWSEDKVRDYIKAQVGSQFDPELAETFLEMVV